MLIFRVILRSRRWVDWPSNTQWASRVEIAKQPTNWVSAFIRGGFLSHAVCRRAVSLPEGSTLRNYFKSSCRISQKTFHFQKTFKTFQTFWKNSKLLKLIFCHSVHMDQSQLILKYITKLQILQVLPKYKVQWAAIKRWFCKLDKNWLNDVVWK